MRICETELIEHHARTLVDMEGSGFASILKVLATAGGRVGGKEGLESSESGVVVDPLAHCRLCHHARPVRPGATVSEPHEGDALSERIRLDGWALVHDQEMKAAPPAAFVKGVLDIGGRASTPWWLTP